MNRNLLAMPVGLKQKDNVDSLVQKVSMLCLSQCISDEVSVSINVSLFYCIQFLPANFTVILFHYDGNMDQWWDLEWSSKAIHIVAHNQTKWYNTIQ